MNLPTTKADYLHERIRFAGNCTRVLIIMILTLFERSKRLLAKNACKSQRSYVLAVNFHLASCLRVG